MGKVVKLPLFLMVFVNVYIHFRIWTRIRNSRVSDPAKVPDPSGSGSTTLPTRKPSYGKEYRYERFVDNILSSNNSTGIVKIGIYSTGAVTNNLFSFICRRTDNQFITYRYQYQ
jgi:hypothetical protein